MENFSSLFMLISSVLCWAKHVSESSGCLSKSHSITYGVVAVGVLPVANQVDLDCGVAVAGEQVSLPTKPKVIWADLIPGTLYITQINGQLKPTG